MIGKLDKRIAIQERSITRVNGVKTDDGWATIETVYGSLEPMNGYERRIAEQNGLIASHKIRMRYRADLGNNNIELLPEHQLVIDSVEYEIRDVINEDFRNEWYDVRAERRA